MRTLDLIEAAAFLRMSPGSLRMKARTGQITAAKPGRRWVFLEEDLVDYLHSLCPIRTTPVNGCNRSWPSTKGIISGGSHSRRPMGSEYAALLGLKTNNKPRSTTTS